VNTLTARLRKLSACPEAVEWAAPYATLLAAWGTCERADWMCWLLVHLHPSTAGQVRLVLCACARTALKYVPAGEERPRLAIECAERYARGLATADELAAAGAAARAAARAAAWNAARDAAWAAAGAAARDAAGDAAGDAAWDAAWDAAGAAAGDAAGTAAWDAAGAAAGDAAGTAAWNAARAAALKEMSVIVRRMISDPENLPPIEIMP
jgi:hypothetical protein